MKESTAEAREQRATGQPLQRPDRDVVADAMRCHTDGCGDQLAGSGASRGWVLVRIIGSGDPPRRYCSGSCATKGIAHVELGHHRLEVAPDASVTPIRQPLPPGRVRATSDVRGGADQRWRDLLTALGKTPADVRAWCADHRVEVPARGPVPQHARDAYTRAHTTEGATA